MNMDYILQTLEINHITGLHFLCQENFFVI